MKLHLNNQDGNRITTYGSNAVTINTDTYSSSLLVLPDRLVTDWQVSGVGGITAAVLEQAAAHASEGMIVLLGGGDTSPPITPEWHVPFTARNAALEIMSLPAACRTYNFLSADGRLVMAALVLEDGE